ncbi:hypothetical protein EON63_24480, partial [archaeon]
MFPFSDDSITILKFIHPPHLSLQEYSDKILQLDAAVKRLDRMNEKRERMVNVPIFAQVQRINSYSSPQH